MNIIPLDVHPRFPLIFQAHQPDSLFHITLLIIKVPAYDGLTAFIFRSHVIYKALQYLIELVLSARIHFWTSIDVDNQKSISIDLSSVVIHLALSFLHRYHVRHDLIFIRVFGEKCGL
jgi:hypothetical protein